MCDPVNGTCLGGCKAGYYGDACDLPCRGHCHDNTCDPVNGICLEGCAAGYFGRNCTNKCGQCACNRETGRCVGGCLFGWKGEFCHVNTHECACADPADGGCDDIPGVSPDGVVNKENVAFGKNATMSSRYRDGQGISAPACAAVNGRTMTQYRTLNQSQSNCVHTDAYDYSPWWKVDLDRPYTVTGVTIYRRADYHFSSRRLAGGRVWVDDHLCYTFPTSNSTERLDALRHKVSVTCAQPLRGQVITFAKDGDDHHHEFYSINICEFQVWVCKAGFYGEHCNQTCTDCPDDLCDNHYGTCLKACPNRTYGPNCQEHCGQCKDNAPCDVTTGHCQHCQPTFLLPFCKEVKGQGEGGHHGYHIESGVLAGAVAGGLALIAVLILGICRCRTLQQKTQNATDSGQLEMETPHTAPPPYWPHPSFEVGMDTLERPERPGIITGQGVVVVVPSCVGDGQGEGEGPEGQQCPQMLTFRDPGATAGSLAKSDAGHLATASGCPLEDDAKQ
ncbi:uncharacterized protein LOC143300005 [Babylonia areolata]|uniref:uncharacterized protein LOC143300005 n=1 Tax=Babylonia areolata TaxID=304850 RepID=UPI003FD1AE28